MLAAFFSLGRGSFQTAKLFPTNKIANLSQQFGTFNCGKCSRRSRFPQCKFCHRMVDYFKIFDIPQKYTVNPLIIKQLTKDLQKQFHPDKHNTESSIEIQKMVQYSSYINEAKATLLNDLQRAIYLMHLRGVELEEGAIDDGAFMMEMFELQQSIELANEEQAAQIQVNLETIIESLQKELAAFFESEDMEKCKEFILKYKYVHRALVNTKKRIVTLKERKIECV